MTTNPPLTEAEQAAAEALAACENDAIRRAHGTRNGKHSDGTDCTWDGRAEAIDYETEARAVVAAVRPILAAQALAWIASSPERWNGYCRHDHMAGVVMKAAEEIRAGLDTVDDAAAEAALEDYFRWEVARRLKDERELILDHRDDLRNKRSRMDQRFTGRLQGLEEAAGMLTTAIKDLSRPTSKEADRG